MSSGSATSAGVGPLAYGTAYYWQVRADNSFGTTYADGGAYWQFTTGGPPAGFAKAAPANGAVGQPVSPTLSWGVSAGATSYEYCIDTTNDSACSGWVSVGSATSAGVGPLAYGTAYYWQVRADNSFGTAYADGAATAFWAFTTGALPGAFGKVAPASGATGQPVSPTLSWGASSGATSYEYCYDTSNDSACSGWVSVGSATSVGIGPLAYGTAYYWQVRANNGFGTTYADGAATAFWAFTTGGPPGAFSKTSPANGATGVSLSPRCGGGCRRGRLRMSTA